jgi:tetratricopeptide (TPR) repeat protein
METKDANNTNVHPAFNGSAKNPRKSGVSALRQSGVQKVLVTVLLLVASAVIFILPNSVTEPWLNYTSQSENTVPSPSATLVSPSTAAEKTKYRQDAQTLLAQIIVHRDRLRDKRVERWGEFEFKQAMLQIERGDQQYQYGEYAESVASYQTALDGLGSLETTGQSILSKAINDTATAIEKNSLSTATTAIGLASAMAPNNQKVQQLSQRVASLPQLIEAMEQGEKNSALSQLRAAREAFSNAVNLDPEHKQAAAALAKTDQKITEQRFRGFMSQGFSALDNDNFEQAKAAFNRASNVYANHPAVEQALAQLETRRSQLWVTTNLARAEEFEKQEKWQQAQSVYQKLLLADATLTDVVVKQIPVNVRADLDSRLQYIIKDPLALAANSQLRQAQKALQDATGISKPGPVLKSQITALKEIIKASQTPIEVALTSDSITNVTLFRVARLGTFDRTSVALKPGRYIAAGTRSGYRDVRIEFTVTGEGFDSPITISCSEAI